MGRATCVLAIVALSPSCQAPATTRCGDDFYCPAGMVCASDAGPCGFPEQVSACRGRTDGDACSYPVTPEGSCFQGVCRAVACGNGVREEGELCDDGNTISGDQCSADCGSTEVCGNGITDPEMGEACDCGDGTVPLPPGCTRENSDQPGATCRPTCLLHGCGDGFVSGSEECEGEDLADQSCPSIGYYAGDLACSPFCRFDTAACVGRCGDHVVNGPELCDGAPPGDSCMSLGFDMGGVGCTPICGVSLASCQRLSWHAMTSHAPGEIYALWGTGPDDVFAAGDLTTIVHYDGSVWSQQDPGVSEVWFVALWGSAHDDVFAVGGGGVISRYDGTTWSPMDSGTGNTLYATWGSGPDDVFASGAAGTILHYDGTTWSPMDSGAGAGEYIEALWGSGPADVFAGGNVIRHFDGDQWMPMQMPPGGPFHVSGLWGNGQGDVYAVGFSLSQTSVLHYDGHNWSVMPLPPALSAESLGKIWGTAAGELFIAGQNGTVGYYDGAHWYRMATDVSKWLYAIWGASPGRIFAAGEYSQVGSDLAGTILAYDGAAWADEPTPSNALGLWAFGADDVYVAGRVGAVSHFDGVSWTGMDSTTSDDLYGLWGSSGELFAVGALGTIVHLDADGWAPMDSGVTAELDAVWGSGPSDVYAVGADGTVLHYQAGGWSPEDPGVSADLTGVWGSGPSDVYAVGADGTMVHFDGGSWQPEDAGVPSWIWLTAVWGSAANDVFAVGDDGTVVHFDGARWTPMSGFTFAHLSTVSGSGPDDVFAGGSDGALFHYDGVGWNPVRSGIASTPAAIQAGPVHVLVAAGDRFLHLLRTWAPP